MFCPIQKVNLKSYQPEMMSETKFLRLTVWFVCARYIQRREYEYFVFYVAGNMILNQLNQFFCYITQYTN